jgi:hypothetical protein
MKKRLYRLILNVLCSARFASWYTGKFEDYITGEKEISKEEILADIESMLRNR